MGELRPEALSRIPVSLKQLSRIMSSEIKMLQMESMFWALTRAFPRGSVVTMSTPNCCKISGAHIHDANFLKSSRHVACNEERSDFSASIYCVEKDLDHENIVVLLRAMPNTSLDCQSLQVL